MGERLPAVHDARRRPLHDPRAAQRRATAWLVTAIAVLAAFVSTRGQLDPRIPPGRFAERDVLLSGGRLDPNTASEAELAAVPGLGPRRAAALVETRTREPFWQIADLDRVPGIGPAALPALEALPGIGPALATRIVADRARGRYRNVTDLDRVAGIGPAKIAALRGRVLP